MRFETGPTHKVTNAVIYCRVSSKAQTKRGDGLNSQETRCREYSKYKGYTVNQVFTDDLTGKSANRPGLNALLAFLKADRKNSYVVVIDDLSRFARRVPLHFELRETIALAGGILESPSVELRDDADGELHEYILASVSQHQSRKNAKQTLNRMQARCFNGYWVFQPPMGYKYEKVEGHGKLLVRNEPIASLIQEALEGYASGRFDAQVEVKRFLESKPDFPKDLPNGEIRSQRITDILTRVTYAGYIEVPNWDIPLRKGHHEGLITLATHQRIQNRIKGGVKSPMRKDINADFPLRGFIVCGDCESPLTACWSKSKTGKKHPYYLCHNRACDSHRKSIRRDQVEGEFEALLRTLKPTEGIFNLTKALFKTVWDWNLQQAGTVKKSMKNEIIQIDLQIEGLVDRIIDSTSPTAIGAYEKRIAKLEREKHLTAEKLKNGSAKKASPERIFELAYRFLSNPWILWSSKNLADKKTVLKLAFSRRLPYCREKGFRTPEISLPFKLLEDMKMQNLEMAHRGGFEPPTP